MDYYLFSFSFFLKPFPSWHSTACSLTTVLLHFLAGYSVLSGAGTWSWSQSVVGVILALPGGVPALHKEDSTCLVSQPEAQGPHSAGARQRRSSSLSMLP